MKFNGFHIPKMIKAISTLLIFMFISGFALSQIQSDYDLKSILDVKGWWKGWLNDPDTIKVKVDSTFNAGDIDSLKVACSRWNAAGCRPALKVVTSGTGEINCTWGTNLSDSAAAEAKWHRDENYYMTGTEIVFRPNNGYNFTELATHELGHPLGLLDTDTATHQKDVMTEKGENGSLGKLSMHDSAEIKRARMIVDSVWGAQLTQAVKIGTRDTIPFKLPQVYPPATSSFVDALGNKYLFIFNFWIIEDYFYIDCMIPPSHWVGMVFFHVMLTFPAPYGDLSFLGSFITSNNPVPPTSFTSPFELKYQDGHINVNWVNLCTYPYSDQALRSDLVVTNLSDFSSVIIHNKDGGNYFLDLDPGTYNIELEVDDFQVNSATYNQTITYTGKEEIPFIQTAQPVVFPNPFNISCEISCDPSSLITILNSKGSLIEKLPPGTFIWTPGQEIPAGVYFIEINSTKGKKTKKVIHLQEGLK